MINVLLYGYMAYKLFNKKGNKDSLPSLGSVKVIHSLPGRYRIHSPKLKNLELGVFLKEQFSKISVITEFHVEITTGNLLVKYDKDKVDEKMLFMSIVRLIDGDEEIEKNEALLTKEIKVLNKALNQGIMNKTNGILDLKSLFIILLSVAAVRQYNKTKTLGSPSVFTLLMWTYNQMKENK